MSIYDPDTAQPVTNFGRLQFGIGRFIPHNLLRIPGAVVTASEADHGDHKIANVTHSDPDLVFNSLANTLTMTAVLPDIQPVDGIGALHSMGYGGSITISLYLEDVLQITLTRPAQRPLYAWGSAPGWRGMTWGGGPLPTDPANVTWPIADTWLSKPVVCDKIVVKFTDSANVVVSYLTVGRAFVPETNFNRLPQFAPVDPVNYTDTPGGGTIIDAGNSKRTINLTWSHLNTTEVVDMINILSKIKNQGTPILISLFPGRGGQIEQQGVALCHPVSWSPPVEGRGDAPFTLTLREVLFNV